MNASSCEHATTPVNTFLFGSAVPCRPLSQTPTGHFYTSIQGEKQAHEDASVDPEFSVRLELREFFALPLKTTFFFTRLRYLHAPHAACLFIGLQLWCSNVFIFPSFGGQ